MTPTSAPVGRRRLATAGGVLALTLGLLSLTATPAQACSCALATDEQAADQSDAVFVGRVDEAYGAASATFVVDEVYKGDVHVYARVVSTGGMGMGCGSEYVRGQTMVVFADYSDGELPDAADGDLIAPPCNGTRALDTPINLTAGHAPLGMADSDGADGFPLLGWLSYAAVAGLGLMPLILWIRLRRTAPTR